MNSNHNIWNTTNPICNQFFMHHDFDEQKNDEYKISSSLKTIWNNGSENRPITSNSQLDPRSDAMERMKNISQTPLSIYVNNMIPVDAGILDNSVKTLGRTSDNATAVANNLNCNSLKGRAITARNGYQCSSYMSNLPVENEISNQVI